MKKLLAIAIALAVPFTGAQAAVGTDFIAGQHEARVEKKESALKAEEPVAVTGDSFATTRFSYNVRAYKKGSKSGDILNKTFLVLGLKTVKYEAVESVPYITKATSENNKPLVYEYANYELKTLIEITPVRVEKSSVLTSYTIEMPVSEFDPNRQQGVDGEVFLDLPSIDTIGRQQSVFIPLDKAFNIGGAIRPVDEKDDGIQVEVTVKQI